MNFLKWLFEKKECEHYWAIEEDKSSRKCIICGKVQFKKIDNWIGI